MIDVLLINPPESGAFFERMPPLGLAHIAAVLERNDYSVRIVDLEVINEGIERSIEEFQPRIIGISGTTHTRFEAFSIAKTIKTINHDIITIYGGVHATFTALDTLSNVREIDYIVCGEGEFTLVKLIQTLDEGGDISHVPGIYYRKRGEIHENPPAERIRDLDRLPRPAYHLLNMDEYAIKMDFVNVRGISMITSRGCHAKCTFCSASRMFDHTVTFHSGERVVDEIEYLLNNFDFKGVKIFDSTFTINNKHCEDICNEIKRRGLRFPWECEIRVGTVDVEVLEKLRDAGCYYVSFGIESGSQDVLDRMRKGFTIHQAEELLSMCTQLGLKTKVFFSFGHIGESVADVKRTFEFIDRHKGKISTIASGAGVRIYPGTFLEEYARQEGILPADFSWSLPFEDKRSKRILQTACVPLLIQPQLGYHDLENIALQIYRRRFGGWQGLKRGVSKITDMKKWSKLWQLLKIRFLQIFGSRV